jgi:two-component system sensor histidine kinase DegS
MNEQRYSLDTLNKSIEQTMNALKKGEDEISSIMHGAIDEYKKAYEDEKIIQSRILIAIKEVDEMEINFKIARLKLIEASKKFEKTDSRIQEAYSYANDLQNSLTTAKEREHELQERRNELARRLINFETTIKKAESAASQIGTVNSFLNGDLKSVGELFKSAEYKMQLGKKIIEAQEEERLRISREIHDGPAQAMANIAIRSELLERIALKNMDNFKTEVKEFKEIVRSSITEIRSIIHNLRPMALDDLGFLPAVEQYIEIYKEKTGLNIALVICDTYKKRIESSLEIALYRTVQESLTNIKKHAEATEIKVKIEILHNEINLEIVDNGKGFIYEENTLHDGQKFGLIGMKERLSLVGGKLVIKSAENKGTIIQVSLSIPNQIVMIK